jgi:hypothetical protein
MIDEAQMCKGGCLKFEKIGDRFVLKFEKSGLPIKVDVDQISHCLPNENFENKPTSDLLKRMVKQTGGDIFSEQTALGIEVTLPQNKSV